MSKTTAHDETLWRRTRAGARAGRGFRYQDAVVAQLAAEGWATGSSLVLVPEGLDDVTFQCASTETRVQIKSRHDARATFSVAEVADYLVKSANLLTPSEWIDEGIRLAVILERPVEGIESQGWAVPLKDYNTVEAVRPILDKLLTGASCFSTAQLLSRAYILVEPDPIAKCVGCIAGKAGISRAIAKIAAHELRITAGRSADDNYALSAAKASRISVSDVAATVERLLLSVDPTALEEAIRAGICEPVDFSTPADEPAFYSGVDVNSSHVAAGLVFERPLIMHAIDEACEQRKAILLSGQSGSGKSAAVWLYAHATRHEVIWYHVRRLDAAGIHLLIRLARANEVGASRPVGFALDDVGRSFSGEWEELVRQAASVPGMLVVASVREEDLNVIGGLPMCALVRPQLDEELAKRLWSALNSGGVPKFGHWREPFEASGGLLLEFTHLLTEGRRMVDVLREQVQRRIREKRRTELRILRCVSFAARYGASVDVGRLRAALHCDEVEFAHALSRLIAEHAVRALGGETVGGLHEIRSRYLDTVLRETLLSSPEQSAKEAVQSLDAKGLAAFIVGYTREFPHGEARLIDALGDRLSSSPLSTWTAAYHGLGLVSCDRIADKWMDIWRTVGQDDRFASFVFNLAVVNAPMDSLKNWERVNIAIRRFTEVRVLDLRGSLEDKVRALPCPPGSDLENLTHFVAALIPLFGAVEQPSVLPWITVPAGDHPIDSLLAFIELVREVSVNAADQTVDALAGSQALLARVHKEVAWVSKPAVETVGDECLVRADVRFVSERLQGNVAERARNLCQLLLAAVPRANLVAVRATAPDGQVIGYGGVPLADYRMPRKNAVTPGRVAWTRAQARAVQHLNESDGESVRANNLSNAICEGVEHLARVAEHFCRLEPIPGKLQARVNVRRLLTNMVKPGRLDSSTSNPLDKGVYETSDTIFDFAIGIQDLAKTLLGKVERPLLSASEAKKLAGTACKVKDDALWRYTDSPPSVALKTAEELLESLAIVFADMHTHPETSFATRAGLSKTSRKHSALVKVAETSLKRAAAMVKTRCEELRLTMLSLGSECHVVARETEFALAWPAVEYAILVPCDELLAFYRVVEHFSAPNAWAGPEWRVLVPVLSGQVVSRCAIGGISDLLPRPNGLDDWKDLPFPLLDDHATRAFTEILSSCAEASAVICGLDRELNEEESNALHDALNQITGKLETYTAMRRNEEDEVIAAATTFLTEVVDRLLAEVTEAGKATALAKEYIGLLTGATSEFQTTLVGYTLMLMEWDSKAVG